MAGVGLPAIILQSKVIITRTCPITIAGLNGMAAAASVRQSCTFRKIRTATESTTVNPLLICRCPVQGRITDMGFALINGGSLHPEPEPEKKNAGKIQLHCPTTGTSPVVPMLNALSDASHAKLPL